MTSRIGLACLVLVFLALSLFHASPLPACCPAPHLGQPVVNADQTVIILWDAKNQTQHFIRKASFRSEGDDFGFIVPSPTQPELEESGNEAFPYLLKLTEPPVIKVWEPVSLTCAAPMGRCGAASGSLNAQGVQVLQEKEVAGFNAVVLEAKTSGALLAWLKEHGYAYSSEVEAWARPYVEQGWKFTALKIAKNKDNKDKTVAAAALRISFKTSRPLFPYREPDPKAAAEALGVKRRMLRIYFLAEARYRGELTKDTSWTGQVVWADRLSPVARKQLLDMLNLPANTGSLTWWLTEFEDWWPYKAAPADVYFSRDSNQHTQHRPPIYQYVSTAWPRDSTVYALAVAVVLPPLVCRLRRR